MIRVVVSAAVLVSVAPAQQRVVFPPGVVLGGSNLSLVINEGVLFLYLTDVAHGEELWRTDGTPAGTWMVTDLEPGPVGSFLPGQANPVSMHGRVYFVAHTSATGLAMWSTDGSPGNANLFHQNPAPFATAVGATQAEGSALYFADLDPATNTYPLYRSDGTAQGITMMPGPPTAWFIVPIFVRALPGAVVYDSSVVGNLVLWRTDGTLANTYQLCNSGPADSVRVGDRLIFLMHASSGTSFDLWSTDGTVPGTHQLANDLNRWTVGVAGSSNARVVDPIVAAGVDRAWIVCVDAAGIDTIITTDGTVGGTTTAMVPLPRVSASNPAWCFLGPVICADQGYFISVRSSVTPSELWRSDGTATGTVSLGTLPGVASRLQRRRARQWHAGRDRRRPAWQATVRMRRDCAGHTLTCQLRRAGGDPLL